MADLTAALEDVLHSYGKDMKDELRRILHYWETETPDHDNGGFFGKIDHENHVYSTAPKGAVLNCRILWAFSAAYNLTKEEHYFDIAKRAFDYIIQHFVDTEYGGVYWTVDSSGKALDTKKQTYATAFAIYGLSEFYKCKNDPVAKNAAIELYNDLVTYSTDPRFDGYLEAFTRTWELHKDLRLSPKDENEKKSMNTHLHVIEGFGNLYSIWPDTNLRSKITGLLEIFDSHIINKNNGHLHLFFDDDWSVKSSLISYGHDIEAAWLLQECAEIISHEEYTMIYKHWAQAMADAAAEGLDRDGGLWYEYEPEQSFLHREKHSWPQAEAMVGFFNAWQVTGDNHQLEKSIEAWKFTNNHILDREKGEWVWGVYEDYSIMNKEDKAGLWKCPYHNTRACLELINRIDSSLK